MTFWDGLVRLAENGLRRKTNQGWGSDLPKERKVHLRICLAWLADGWLLGWLRVRSETEIWIVE
jgi:hypothetical protein